MNEYQGKGNKRVWNGNDERSGSEEEEHEKSYGLIKSLEESWSRSMKVLLGFMSYPTGGCETGEEWATAKKKMAWFMGMIYSTV